MTRSLLLLLLAASLGCKTDSTSVLTSGMSAYFAVLATGTGATTASASLFLGDPTQLIFVELHGNDALVASTGAQSHTLAESNVLNIISYSASFTGADAEGTSYRVALNRTIDAGAPSSTCTLPAALSLSAPSASAQFSRANADVVVSYAPSGTSDSIRYDVGIGSDCLQPLSSTLSGDAGSFTIAKGALQPKDSAHSGASCAATITVSRVRAGALDPAYGKGGNITCIQARAVSITSVP